MPIGRPEVDVERIRVAAEYELRASLERELPGARSTHVKQDGPGARRQLLAGALLLSDTMAPDAYAAARDAMALLGVADTIELFQSAGHGIDNARLVLYGNPIGVELIGGYLARLDRAQLLAVLGHEIGHCLAHCGNPAFAWALSASQAGRTPTLRAYAMAAELTADRFGLLACRDLDSVLRLEMQTAAGRSATTIRFDTDAYLTQCHAVAEETISRGGLVNGSTHPEHYIRAYAEWLFTETDVYASITGRGNGSRSIEEVDGTLKKLLGVRARAASPATTSSVIAKPTTSAGAPVRRPIASPPPNDDASDVITDAAHRTLVTAGEVIATVTRAVRPSFERLIATARSHLGSTETGPPSRENDDAPDPLEQERLDLIARFEELEKRDGER